MSQQFSRKVAELAPKIMGAFHDLGRRHPEGEQITMRQYQALIITANAEKLSLSEFGEKLNLAPSTGTELANRMIELGYLKKAGDSPDRRQVLLSVTERGYALLQERLEALTTMFEKFLEPFTMEDREKFALSFEQIWELIQKYSQSKS